MRAWWMAAVLLAGCGPVRMDAVSHDRSSRAERLYTRADPDARESALESAGGDACLDDRKGKLAMLLCPDVEKLRVGEPAVLRFRVELNEADGPRLVRNALIAVALRHRGGRAAALVHPDPQVSGVREASPGIYETTAVFPAEGRWTVEAAVVFPDDEAVRLSFEVIVAPSVGGGVR